MCRRSLTASSLLCNEPTWLGSKQPDLQLSQSVSLSWLITGCINETLAAGIVLQRTPTQGFTEMKLTQIQSISGTSKQLTDASLSVESAVLMIQAMTRCGSFLDCFNNLRWSQSPTKAVFRSSRLEWQGRDSWTLEVETIFEGTEDEISQLITTIQQNA
jgi:hypothetical protein